MQQPSTLKNIYDNFTTTESSNRTAAGYWTYEINDSNIPDVHVLVGKDHHFKGKVVDCTMECPYLRCLVHLERFGMSLFICVDKVANTNTCIISVYLLFEICPYYYIPALKECEYTVLPFCVCLSVRTWHIYIAIVLATFNRKCLKC